MTADEATRLLSTPDEFQTWLNQFPDEKKIATARCADDCPIARFLKDCGASDVSVEGHHVEVYHQGVGWEELEPPYWVDEYVDYLDQYVGGCYAVSAKQARRAMKYALDGLMEAWS